MRIAKVARCALVIAAMIVAPVLGATAVHAATGSHGVTVADTPWGPGAVSIITPADTPWGPGATS
ncbi:MAG TPA: hypothetical protein VH333_11930 [Pseudonocardiaceae bacterium]|nr:hypothetical protein [Pseudonocardiaceae bacterium]